MADQSIAEMAEPPLPTLDYRYIRLPKKLHEQSRVATGRMIGAALADIFAKDDLPMVSMLGVSGAIAAHADTVRDVFDERGLLAARPGRELDPLVVLYTAGHCIQHRNFGYRGVIVGTAEEHCKMNDRWIAQMNVDNLPRGRYQPWYHVLVDVRDRSPPQTCYVCHENIILWKDPPDDGRALGPIVHPDIRRAFTSWDRETRLYLGTLGDTFHIRKRTDTSNPSESTQM